PPGHRFRDVLLGGQLAAGVQDLAVSPAILGEQGNEIVLHGDLSWAGEGSNVWSLRRRGLRLGQGRHSPDSQFTSSCGSGQRSSGRGAVEYWSRIDLSTAPTSRPERGA